MYRKLDFEVVELFCEPGGSFPNHHPDPTVEANLATYRAEVEGWIKASAPEVDLEADPNH